VAELIALVASYPRDNPELALDPADAEAFRGHYANALYQARAALDARPRTLCPLSASPQCAFALIIF